MKSALQYKVSEANLDCFSYSTVDTPITSPTSNNLNHMKTILNSNHVLCFLTDNSYWDIKTLSSQYSSSLDGEKICIKQVDNNSEFTGHALSIVGYDDSISYDLNGDGELSMLDATDIQRRASGSITEFSNGHYAVI